MIKKEKIIEKLKEVIDPELNVNIVDMGLIYDVKIYSSREAKRSREVQNDNSSRQDGYHMVPRQARTINYDSVDIKMTLTSPGCPLSFVFEEWIREAVLKIKGVKNVTINLVWEPAWSPDRMTDEAKEKLGIIE